MDSLARVREERRRADSVKAPLPHAERPVLTSVSPYQWDREPLFAAGALTLGDLLDAVPGITVYRSAWIGSPHAAAFLGDFRRVRIFYEGIELDPLDPRTGRIHDLSLIDLWQLEDVRVEQGADEMRVYLGSWRVRSTTPATRVDFSTGDFDTNAYRGYYGRRLSGGQLLQLGAYQYSTADERDGGDAQQLSLWARLGWAKKRWSFDASLLSSNRERAVQARLPDRPELPKFDGTYATTYARLGYGDPTQGLWFQATAARQRFTLHVDPYVISVDNTNPAAPDTTFGTDSTNSRPQYVLTGGYAVGPVHLSAIGRIRTGSGSTDVSPGVRAALERGVLALSVYGERSPNDSVLRTEVSGRLRLLPWLSLSAAVGRRAPIEGSSIPTSLSTRMEVGLRLGRMWATGGIMTRDTATLSPPIVFDTGFVGAPQGSRPATFATMRGKFWQDVGLDAYAVRFANAGPYRPQYQTRARLYFDSSLPRRFPSGNLNILAAVTHEYRSYALFPVSAEVLRSSQYRTWGFLLEIRLLNATLSYQFRNFLLTDYAQVPGFRMPRPVNFYGIRWNFYN